MRVALGTRSYDIRIGQGVLDQISDVLAETVSAGHAVLISDNHVAPLYAAAVREAIEAGGCRTDLCVIEAGEPSKSVATAHSLWNQVLALGADRKTAIVALGGGVVGDLAGFIAATFARGLPFLQIPTSLLAQVDSSVGGKVGINLDQAKNMVGAFLQPQAVLIDTGVLETLPDREYSAGWAEVVKYGVIMDADFFGYLEGQLDAIAKMDQSVLQHVIAHCCRLKAEVVAEDELETNRRAILNYGHTFAHALEAVSGYGQLLHGEAVAIGMLCASRLAESLGRISPDCTARQSALLTALKLPTQVPVLPRDALWAAMQSDKKASKGALQFILPTALGHVELVGGIERAKVQAAWDGPQP